MSESANQYTPTYQRWILPLSACFGGLLLLYGICSTPLEGILPGLQEIILREDVLITDYIAIAGIGPAFVNSGLVTLVAVLLLKLTGDTSNGATLVTVGLLSGFSLFGMNIANIWPIILGTLGYALVKWEPLSQHVNLALRATALAPVVSFLSAWHHPFVGIGMGLVIGFVIPPVADHAHRLQNGMNLYSLGFACGLVGMILIPVFKAYGMNPQSALYWSTGNNLQLGIALGVLCLGFILGGLSRSAPTVLRNYWMLLHTSGRAPSDYIRTFPPGAVLVNMGVNGLLAMVFLLLAGGDLNGATIGAIFTILGFSAYGKHAFNVLPVMSGVFLGSLLNHIQFNVPSLQLALLFGTTLAPFSGVFGWPFGVLAGLLHSSVVLQAGLPLEGMNLYNNGFSGGLIAVVLYPILTSLVHHRRPVLQEEDLFAMFSESAPQDVSVLTQRDEEEASAEAAR